MGVWTSFLNLFKPDRTENYDVITQQNDNWDKIDAGVKAVSDDLGNPSSASAVTGADAFSKIATLNSKIGYVEAATTFTGVTSLDVLKTGLQNVANGVDIDHNKLIRFYSGFTGNGFIANRRYKGYLMVFEKSGSTATVFTILFEGEEGHNVSVAYRNSTWTVEELALNSNISSLYYYQSDQQAVNANEETIINITQPTGYSYGVVIGVTGTDSTRKINILSSETTGSTLKVVKVISTSAQTVVVRTLWFK